MIIVGVTFVQCPLGDLKRAIGVLAGLFYCLRCVTRRRKASFGHNSGSAVSPWPSPPPLHVIFLCAECEYHKGGVGEFIVCGGGGIEYRADDTEGYI